MSNNPLGLAFFILYWVVFIYSIVLHEVAHGYSSYLLGDPTAWKAGRLTLNPLRHVDFFFSILMPVIFYLTAGVPFGGAKPVPVNPYLYRNLRWGSLASAAAGPLTNLVLAACFSVLFLLFKAPPGGHPSLTGSFLANCLVLNVFLGVFNLLPVPPLDGSHVLAALLPRSMREVYGRFQAMGWWPIVVLVIFDQLLARATHFSILAALIIYPAYLVLWLMGAEGALRELVSPSRLLQFQSGG